MKNKKLIPIFIILFLLSYDLYQSDTYTYEQKEEEQKKEFIIEPEIEIPQETANEEENNPPKVQEKKQNSQTHKRSTSWRQGIFVDITPKT